MFTYYTIIGRDLNLLKDHVNNVKEYAGFNRISGDKEFLVIVYKNPNIPEHVTDDIISYCNSQNIKTHIYNEPTDVFIHNLYACWNLGYEVAKPGYVFRAGSDQVFSKDSFTSLYECASKAPDKTILQANTIENLTKIQQLGTVSRHFAKDFGVNFETFNYNEFEKFCSEINTQVDGELVDISEALRVWGHPTQFTSSMGVINRADGCSWLMTKDNWETFGPIPAIENNVTGDIIIHDRMQMAGYESYIVRDCITYHFVQGESNQI